MSEEGWASLKVFILKSVSEVHPNELLHWYESAFRTIEAYGLDFDNYTGPHYRTFVKEISSSLKIEYKDLPRQVYRGGTPGRVVKWRLETGR